MLASPVNILGFMLCIVALVHEYPEAMSAIGQAFLALWFYRRFVR